ncbi:MAG: sulfatase-like hydrolase/transferase, partial [Bryobacteraceae bacterium]
GFDEFFGYLDQKHAHTYYPTQLWDNEREHMLDGNFGPDQRDYSHDIFTKRALDFVDRHKDQPFFLYLAYTIPHANNELTRMSGNGMQVPSDAPYSDRDWPQPDKNFAAMITRLDKDVGELLGRLKSLGIEQDTLVLFSSDNGPHKEGGNNPEFFNSNGPLRGIKRDLYDGGIRVPAIARWPQKIRPNQVSDQVWAFWDFLPTAAEVAGASAPTGLDGISIVPALNGKPLPKREYLYWEFHERGFSQAVRTGDWKGVRPKSMSAPIELYNIKEDIGETRDVASEHPDVVKRIAGFMQAAHVDSELFPVKEPSPSA